MASTASPFSFSVELSSKPRLKHSIFKPNNTAELSLQVASLRSSALEASICRWKSRIMANSGSAASTVVEVELGSRSYPIYIGSGLLDQPQLLQRHVHGKRVLVVINNRVAPLYLEKAVDALTRDNPNVSVESLILPDGEKYKSMLDKKVVLTIKARPSEGSAGKLCFHW